MGRYAFFNTKLEYKFRFGIQSSSDMRRFGGRICHEKYQGGDFHHEWEKKDMEFIKGEIDYLLKWFNEGQFKEEEPVKFEAYEKNLEGTYTLKEDLYDLYKKGHDEELLARYILGCCIYHQLLYADKLTVHYEGWD
ncbi:MAG: hypothetical protein EBU82_08650 [Flavobacteriia bacterium]|nr:hypothetical protein [Flavobacteriia bacterium]